MPNLVYRLDPATRAVRVVADQFLRPNGLAFSVDGATAFVTDTGASGGFLGNNGTDPATMYVCTPLYSFSLMSTAPMRARADSGPRQIPVRRRPGDAAVHEPARIFVRGRGRTGWHPGRRRRQRLLRVRGRRAGMCPRAPLSFHLFPPSPLEPRHSHLIDVRPPAQVWSPAGVLIGKFFLGTTSANLVFANPGRLVIMAETAIYLAEIAAQGPDLANLG
jgi:hypothetical protein